MLVKYVGKREKYKDGLYGTGTWECGQVKDVPPDAAMKMLGHHDQYRDAGNGESVLSLAEAGSEKAFMSKACEILERVKVRFLDAVLEAGEHSLEVVEALGEQLTMAITAEMVPAEMPVEKVVVEEKKKEEKDDDEARDLVANMNKEQLDNYAMVNFKEKIHPNMSVDNARKKVIGLIDQFGLK